MNYQLVTHSGDISKLVRENQNILFCAMYGLDHITTTMEKILCSQEIIDLTKEKEIIVCGGYILGKPKVMSTFLQKEVLANSGHTIPFFEFYCKGRFESSKVKSTGGFISKPNLIKIINEIY